MENANSVTTPVSCGSQLVKARDSDKRANQALYPSAVGCLLYPSTRTRPDIAFAVNNVAKYCSDPTEEHWTAVKRILRYGKGTRDLGLLYTNDKPKECVGYSDADWGGDADDHKSTSGYLFQIGTTAVTWRSKKQTCVALSTGEAEYIALSSAIQEAIWLRELTTELVKEPTKSTVIYEDNQSAISMARNPQFHGRTKHIGIKYHYIREEVNHRRVELIYCLTEDMIADVLTKGVSQERFEKLIQMCGMSCINLTASRGVLERSPFVILILVTHVKTM